MATRTQFDLSYLSLKPAELNAFLAPYTDTIKTSQLVTSDVIQYSFYSAKNQLPDSALNDPDVRGPIVFKPFTSAEQDTTKTILSMLETATGLRFEQVAAGEGELRLGKYNMKSGFAPPTDPPDCPMLSLMSSSPSVGSAGGQCGCHDWPFGVAPCHHGGYPAQGE